MSFYGAVGLGVNRGPECPPRAKVGVEGLVVFRLGVTRSEAILMRRLRQAEEGN